MAREKSVSLFHSHFPHGPVPADDFATRYAGFLSTIAACGYNEPTMRRNLIAFLVLANDAILVRRKRRCPELNGIFFAAGCVVVRQA